MTCSEFASSGPRNELSMCEVMHHGAVNSACRTRQPVSRITFKTSDSASTACSPLSISSCPPGPAAGVSEHNYGRAAKTALVPITILAPRPRRHHERASRRFGSSFKRGDEHASCNSHGTMLLRVGGNKRHRCARGDGLLPLRILPRLVGGPHQCLHPVEDRHGEGDKRCRQDRHLSQDRSQPPPVLP